MKEKRSGEKNILFIFPEDSVFKTKNKLDQGTSGIRRDLKQKNRRKLVEKRALSPWARHPSQKTSRISQSPLPKNQEKRSAWTATGTFLNVAVKKELHHSRFYSRATNTKIISVGSMLNPPLTTKNHSFGWFLKHTEHQTKKFFPASKRDQNVCLKIQKIQVNLR